VPENELCPVCKHPTQVADIAHIFGSCIVAGEHNLKLWTKLKNQHTELQSTPCWFIVSENNNNNNSNAQAGFKVANWDAYLGNIGYISTRIANKLDKEQQIKMAQTVAGSKHELWIDYWIMYVQLLLSTTSSSNTASAMDDSGLVAISPTDRGPPVVVAESSLSASRKQKAGSGGLGGSLDVGPNGKKMKQLDNYFLQRK
jgi:hypothetical protein